ncbi:MAG: 1,4-dihydroxy-2-naphthoate polyprenyltransferase, partial [Propionibacteriaceae bacterium]|nr:1,4-dihydroxy-2-naphthoate polyprenyltransferase [Propionibacteriaceae bacterium]
MATRAQWIEGARLRTLPLAVSSVIVGTAVAIAHDQVRPVRALLALIVGLSLQIGVNLANDYSDGVRGTDAYRVGPQRLVGSGAAAPRTVKRAA